MPKSSNKSHFVALQVPQASILISVNQMCSVLCPSATGSHTCIDFRHLYKLYLKDNNKKNNKKNTQTPLTMTFMCTSMYGG